MNGATWRDVVAAVLETCQSPVSLAYIYEQVEPYTKGAEKTSGGKRRFAKPCNAVRSSSCI